LQNGVEISAFGRGEHATESTAVDYIEGFFFLMNFGIKIGREGQDTEKTQRRQKKAGIKSAMNPS
jgi:hypothetical protein